MISTYLKTKRNEFSQIISTLWYKNQVFIIEEPTSEEIKGAKYRVCLYFE